MRLSTRRLLAALDLEESAEPAMERRRAARHETRLQHLEDLFTGGAEPHRALHVRDQAGLVGAAEGQERDGHELAHLGRDVPALAQSQLVDAVIRFDEIRVLPGRELPLRVDVAARFLHALDERVRAARLRTVVLHLDLGHVGTSSPRRVSHPDDLGRSAFGSRRMRSGRLTSNRRSRPMANVLTVVAKIRAAKGKGDALAALLAEQAGVVKKAEPGCLVYRPHRSSKDPDLFIFYEMYKDDAAFDLHRKAPHLASYRERREKEGLTEGAAEVEIYRSLTD